LEWVPLPGGTLSLSTTASTNLAGSIQFDLVSPLVGSVTPLSMDVFVYVRGGDDLEFADYCGVNDTLVTAVLTSREVSLEKGKPKAIVCQLGETQVITDNTTLITFGECVQSLRALFKRSEPIFLSRALTDDSTTWAWWNFSLFLSPPPYKLAVTGFNTPVISLFSYSYMGMKGGLRYTVIPWQPLVNDVVNAGVDTRVINAFAKYVPSAYVASDWTTAPTATGFPIQAGPNSVGIEYFRPETGAIDIELPDRTPGAFRYTSGINLGATSSLDPGQVGNFSAALVTIHARSIQSSVGVYTKANTTILIAAADDFSYFGYIGPPIMTIA
jgi:hypothetical protein